MGYHARAKLICRYSDRDTAEKLLETVMPDNEGYICSTLEGNVIVSTVEGDSILSMRSTLDDFLACLGTAERVILKHD